MKEIRFDHPHRRAHFAFYRAMAQPQFSLCAPVRVERLLELVRSRSLPFTPTLVYVLASAANSLPQLRQRIRGERVVEHEVVHPSMTVPARDTDVHGFCELRFGPDFAAFLQAAQAELARRSREPTLADEPGRDDYLFLSAIPWVAFTAVSHAMLGGADDSVPRIAWGRFERSREGGMVMPVSLQVHHALVDGWHVGRFFEVLQERLDNPAKTCGLGPPPLAADDTVQSAPATAPGPAGGTIGDAVQAALAAGDGDGAVEERGPAVLIAARGDGETLLPQRADRAKVEPMRTMPVSRSVFTGEAVVSQEKRLEALQALIDDESRVFLLEKSGRNAAGEIKVGRSSRNDVVMKDHGVSGEHAAILFDGDRYTLSDLGSSNGTFLNRGRLSPGGAVALADGDCVRFGGRVLYFLHHDTFVLLVELRAAARR